MLFRSQGKSVEKTIPLTGTTYLYKDHAGTFDDGDQITINYTGLRQFAGNVKNLDSKYAGNYLQSNYLNILNNFEGVTPVFGSIQIENSTITGNFSDFYWKKSIPYPLKSIPNTSLGLSWQFLNWSDGVTTADRTVLVDRDITLTANWKAMMASNSGNWVQSVTPYTANGTRAVAYFSPNPDGETGIWFHQENGAVATEVNITADQYLDLKTSANLISVAVADYNKQKSYLGYLGMDPGYQNLLSVREIINGKETGFTQVMLGIEDPVVNGFSSNAKLYISPYLNSTSWLPTFGKFLVVVVDGLNVFTRTGNMSSDNSTLTGWDAWSSFTVNSTPVVSTNGKTMYINWLQNGNLVGRRFLQTNWGSTYTLYSNTGGNFVNFTATVNSTDDLVLMMTRQNSLNSRSMCFGKRYYSGSSAPVTVLETMSFPLYNAFSLATENGKILASIGKSSPDGEIFNYYLWKNDGTSWTKETTAFSSTPARLLHNEVDVRP
ncbi:MAG: hypothetical protein HBSAPP04_28120 [Ignavibacteriaceae bacterium]|nr:MAG: hypothetical protein HBSAPP04_28120 [Ignavibacteriaceae bacterium]